jgi:hypothetical protein
MIRRAIVTSTAVLFLALALPVPANAQSIFVLGGVSLPSGDYGDEDILDAGTGWLAAGGVTIPVGAAGLWVGAEGLYGRNGISDIDESFKLFSVMGVVGYDIPTEATVSPYVFGGLGLMSLSTTEEDSDSESGFGWQLGGGVGFETGGKINPFVEGRFQSASIDDDEGESFTVSILAVEAGVSISLGDY